MTAHTVHAGEHYPSLCLACIRSEMEYEELREVTDTSSDPAVVFMALAAQGVDLFGEDGARHGSL